MPQIEVTFDIDANGILHVGAKDLGTGKEQKITISGGSSLSKEEIERMVKDAEAHAEEDKTRREEAEARNIGDSLVYQTEKFIKDNEEKLSQGDAAAKKSEVDVALADLKSALAGADIAAIKSATEKLLTTSQGFSQRLYEEAAKANASGPAASQGNDDDIVDAEIVAFPCCSDELPEMPCVAPPQELIVQPFTPLVFDVLDACGIHGGLPRLLAALLHSGSLLVAESLLLRLRRELLESDGQFVFEFPPLSVGGQRLHRVALVPQEEDQTAGGLDVPFRHTPGVALVDLLLFSWRRLVR